MPRLPYAIQVSKGHGRWEWREIRVSSALTDDRPMPGLASVAERRAPLTVGKPGRVREQVRSVLTSRTAAEADAQRLLERSRAHGRIENTCLHVKDDSVGIDLPVLQRHRSGAVLAALRSTAQALLRETCRLWAPAAPLIARAEWVTAYPVMIPAALGPPRL